MLLSAWLFRLGFLLLGFTSTTGASPVPVGHFPSDPIAWPDWTVEDAPRVDGTRTAEPWGASQLGPQPQYHTVHSGPPFQLDLQPFHYAGQAGPSFQLGAHPSSSTLGYPGETRHTQAHLNLLRSSTSSHGANKAGPSSATQDDNDEYIQTLLGNAALSREAVWTVQPAREPHGPATSMNAGPVPQMPGSSRYAPYAMRIEAGSRASRPVGAAQSGLPRRVAPHKAETTRQSQQGRRDATEPSTGPETPITRDDKLPRSLDSGRFPSEVQPASLIFTGTANVGTQHEPIWRDTFLHGTCFPANPHSRPVLFYTQSDYKVVRANDADRALVQNTIQHRLDSLKGSVRFEQDPVAYFDPSIVVRDEKWLRFDLIYHHNHLGVFLRGSKGRLSTIRINGYWLVFRQVPMSKRKGLPDPGEPWILNHVTATSQGADMFEVGYMWSNVNLKSVSFDRAMTLTGA